MAVTRSSNSRRGKVTNRRGRGCRLFFNFPSTARILVSYTFFYTSTHDRTAAGDRRFICAAFATMRIIQRGHFSKYAYVVGTYTRTNTTTTTFCRGFTFEKCQLVLISICTRIYTFFFSLHSRLSIFPVFISAFCGHLSPSLVSQHLWKFFTDDVGARVAYV